MCFTTGLARLVLLWPCVDVHSIRAHIYITQVMSPLNVIDVLNSDDIENKWFVLLVWSADSTYRPA